MKRILLSSFLIATMAIGTSAQRPIYLDASRPLEDRVEDALSRMTLQEKIRVIHAQSKFSSAGIPRLGFPDFWTDDGPHGVRPDVLWDEWEQAGQSNDSCIAFPALTCLASTWNPEMSLLYGKSLGEEARYRGKNMILGPGVNINRTPINGRNFEYLGEDPYLSSKMVVPYIQGLQSMGVAACVKHYALNNDETYRNQVNVIVDDRALHEIYLPAFKAAVEEGKTWGIMGAYNLYKDQHNCHNQYLLNDILKHDWKYDGVVVSDWGGTHDTEQAINNGLDMEFGTWTDGLKSGATNAYDNYFMALPYQRLINEGKYSTKELDEKVRRVLRLFYRTTMDETPKQGFLCSESHYDAAKKIGEEGIVLLKNDKNVLPIRLNNTMNVLVVGENAIKMMTVGGGSSSLKVQREVSPLDGLKARLGNQVKIEYARGYVGDVTGDYNGVTTGQNLAENRSSEQLIAEAVEKAKHADYVIFFGGLNKSSNQDCEGTDRQSYELPYHQDNVISSLAKVNKNFIYVNISGNAVAMPWIKEVPAIIQAWYLGSQTSEALASILVGDSNPSGKLPFTWAKDLRDIPAHQLNTYPGTWRADKKIIDEEYKEGIFVGYRWVDKVKSKPIFAFGHGLSYTSFKLSNLRLSAQQMTKDGQISVKVNVSNQGKVAGSEVVQLYISDLKCSLPRPQKELKGFSKVFLKPGENKDVTISIESSALRFYDDRIAQWTSEPGEFEVLVGNASDQLTLKKTFVLK